MLALFNLLIVVELLRTIDAERMELIPLGQPYGMSPPLQIVPQPLQLVSLVS